MGLLRLQHGVAQPSMATPTPGSVQATPSPLLRVLVCGENNLSRPSRDRPHFFMSLSPQCHAQNAL